MWSSDYHKKYQVFWQDKQYTSNDNATFWQGYPGYPVIAVLLLQGYIPYQEAILPFFKDINWHALNEKYKRNYDAAIDEAFINLTKKEKDQITKEVNKIYESLLSLNILIVRKIKNLC